MSRILLGALSAILVAGQSFAAVRPVAHWDVVPYQRVGTPFQAGVVAMYDKPIRVVFSVNGSKVAEVANPSRNARTRVDEYWFTLDPARFEAGALADRVMRLGAKVVADDGTSYDVPEVNLYWNVDGAAGSTKTIWVDDKTGIDYADGSKGSPVKTIKQAIKLAGDGGTIYIASRGTYSIQRIGGGSGRRFWTTITPAPGLSRKDVTLVGGRTGCSRLCLKGLTIVSDVVGSTGYALGGVDDKSTCWVDDCIIRDKGGRAAGRSYVFGNRLVGYVTGGATTEMGDGPRAKLVRNHVLKTLSGDVFSGGDILVANCRVDDVDGSGVVEGPALHRSQGIKGAWTENVIFLNVTATNLRCHGLVGVRLRDSVFKNVKIESAVDDGSCFSRYAQEMENVWFDNVALAGQEWIWFNAAVDAFAPTDVRVTNCSFKLNN